MIGGIFGDACDLEFARWRWPLRATNGGRIDRDEGAILAVRKDTLANGVNFDSSDLSRQLLSLHIGNDDVCACLVECYLRIKLSQELFAHVELLGEQLLRTRVAQMFEARLVAVIFRHLLDEGSGNVLFLNGVCYQRRLMVILGQRVPHLLDNLFTARKAAHLSERSDGLAGVFPAIRIDLTRRGMSSV